MKASWILMALFTVGCEKARVVGAAETSRAAVAEESRDPATAGEPAKRDEGVGIKQKVSGQDVMFPSTPEMAAKYSDAQREVFTENYQRALEDHQRKKEEKLGDTLPSVTVGNLNREQPAVERAEPPPESEPAAEPPPAEIVIGDE